jgi:hypothetical protein
MGNTNTPKPWERQPDETAKPYEAFCVYRDMGTERSLRKVSERLGKSETLMARWSTKNNWVERAAAWDDEQERIEREITQKQQREDIKKMRKRHAALATQMLLKAATALSSLKEEDVKAADISRMVDVASKLERISRGDVGDVVEERDGGKAIDPVQIYLPDNNRGRNKDNLDDIEV